MPDITRNKRQATKGALRIFFVDQRTGNPVAGVVVRIFADSAADSDSQSRLIATMEAGPDGYISYKFHRSLLGASSRLTIVPGVLRADAERFAVQDLMDSSVAHTIRLDASALVTVASQSGLPSIIEPDAYDVALSPSSIGLIPQLARRSICNELMPTTMAVRRFRAFQILADVCNDTELLDCPGPGPIEIVRGMMLEYEIAWYPAGTALGELLSTISLAPCEQITVAIMDWMHRETASETLAADVRQQEMQQMDHNRMMNETIQSSIESSSSAWSFGGSISFPIKEVDLTAAFGGGASNVASAQHVSATTTNQLSDRITQQASFVASRRSSVVFQTTASEQRQFQTRTLRNSNHCSTLNLMYYQVNRNYNVVTEYKGHRDVILVKYTNVAFDAERTFCNAHVLKNALLDPSLRSCFDALGDALFCCKEPSIAGLMYSLTLTVKQAMSQNLASIRIILVTPTGAIQLVIDATGWSGGGTNSGTIHLPNTVDPSQVLQMHLSLNATSGGLPTLTYNEIEVNYQVFGLNAPLTLYSSQVPNTINGFWSTAVPTQMLQTGKDLKGCVALSCCVQKLLGHLNCHKRYYNRHVFLNLDPNDRVAWMSCCHKGGVPFSLINQIENMPVTTYGDYVVFPAAGSMLVIEPGSEIPPVSQLVTFPTPGVYAEGVLGQCNTCEKIDPDTFWNWKDSPCPDIASPVDNPQGPQPIVKPDDLKAEAITNLINLSTVPSAPDSIIKDLISELVAKADGGSAEAKGLLEKLLDKVKEGLK